MMGTYKRVLEERKFQNQWVHISHVELSLKQNDETSPKNKNMMMYDLFLKEPKLLLTIRKTKHNKNIRLFTSEYERKFMF